MRIAEENHAKKIYFLQEAQQQGATGWEISVAAKVSR